MKSFILHMNRRDLEDSVPGKAHSAAAVRRISGAGFHGCINMPPGKAEELYSILESGTSANPLFK